MFPLEICKKKDTELQIATIMFSLGILQKDMFPRGK